MRSGKLVVHEGGGDERRRCRDKSDCFESASSFWRVKARQWQQRQIGRVESSKSEGGNVKMHKIESLDSMYLTTQLTH